MNQPSEKKLRIGIDARLSGIKHAGIGRYIEELLREVTQDDSIHWVIFLAEPNQLPWLSPTTNIELVYTPVRHYTIAEQLVMPALFAKARLDLLHVPHFNVPLFYRGKFIVTIHDLLWHEQQGSHMTTLSPLVYRLKYLFYRFISSSAISRAQRVIVPTEVVKQTLLTHVSGIDAKKVHVITEGVGKEWFKGAGTKQSEKSHTLFYTGSLYPHKNVLLAVDALKSLPEYELAISSSRNIFVEKFMAQVKELGMTERVHHLGRLSDDDLRAWYHKSFALVQPSLSEGFGLTGVEAMAAGLPVLASDIPVFREIYRNAFLAFDPKDPESLVNAVKKLTLKQRETLIAHGKKLAREYSWEEMGKSTLATYHLALTNESTEKKMVEG